MGNADFYRAGSFNRICDRCSRKRKAEDTVKEWTGLIVCRDCVDPRHPQDFVRARHDRQAVHDPRPEYTGELLRMDLESVTIDDEFVTIDAQGDRFLDTNEVTADSL